MKDLTHYFQSPSREDEDTEAEILLGMDESPLEKLIGNDTGIKKTVSRSRTRVIVSCDRSDCGSSERKRKKRKVKNNIILDLETVANNSENAETILIASTEVQNTSHFDSCGTVASPMAKNSTKSSYSEHSKHSGRTGKCRLGAINSSTEERTSKSFSSECSDVKPSDRMDAFEVLMSVHVRNVDDECVAIEKKGKGSNVCVSDEGTASNALRRDGKNKRKHNLEEMASRNRKRRSASIDCPGKQKRKKWKHVRVEDSDSEDSHNKYIEQQIVKECVDSKELVDSGNSAENVEGAKMKSQKRLHLPVGSSTEEKGRVLELDSNTKHSDLDLDKQDILMLQYEKTLKHIRKAEKALRKFEILKNLQEKTGSAIKVSESDCRKLSTMKINLKDIDEQYRNEGSNSDKAPICGEVSSKPVKSLDIQSKKHHASTKKIEMNQETVSSVVENSEILENCTETKKESIFSYFSKVSKEEVLSKSQRLSVQVLIHSPPSTPLKEKTEASLTPQTSRQKKRLKRNQKPKEVPDKIDILSSEIVKILDGSPVENARLHCPADVNDTKMSSLRSWKVRMVSETPSTNDGYTDSGSDQDEVELVESSDSVFTPPKKRKDFGNGKQKVYTLLDEKVAHTPRCSRRLAMKNGVSVKCLSTLNEVADTSVSCMLKHEKLETLQKSSVVAVPKEVKLAPLFLQDRIKKKGKLDPAIIEARKNFLMSGVPDAVQKMINLQKSFEDQSYDVFPEVSHIQQTDCNSYIWNLPRENSLILKPEPAADCGPIKSSKLLTLGMFTSTEQTECRTEKNDSSPPITAFRKILREMKQEFPDFPIYRMFRSLRSKFLRVESTASTVAEFSSEPLARKSKRRARSTKSGKQISACATPSLSQAHVMWAEKYRPLCADDMFSNLASVRHLKTWLVSWKKYVDEMNATESAMNHESGEESFVGDDDNSGSEHGAVPSNTTILVGPVGCGKTASVYAIASELDCKVLEINASSKRTGKRMLTEFLEATQSHQVSKSSEQSVGSIKGFFKENSSAKNRKRHSKVDETKPTQIEEDNCKKLSIILVEDVDLVFEDQDDGFLSALSVLLTSSKRPVIVTSSDPSCPHLSKLMLQYCVLEFVPPPARLISVWLQLVSLLQGNRFSNLALQRLFSTCGCDMRRTIHNLQFWTQKSGNCVDSVNRLLALAPMADGSQRPEADASTEDDSNLVWSSSRRMDEKEALHVPVCDASLFVSHCDVPPLCSQLGALWWNIGSLLGVRAHKRFCLPSVRGSFEQKNFISGFCSTEGEEIVETNSIHDDLEDNAVIPEESQSLGGDKDTVVCFSAGVESNERKVDCKPLPQRSTTCLQVQMDSLSRLTDVLSETCVIYSGCLQHNDTVDLEPCVRPWEQVVKDSISLKDDVHMCSYSEKLVSRELCSYLVHESIEQCSISLARAINRNGEQFQKPDWSEAVGPSAEQLRWRAQKHKADDAVLAAVSLSSALDHSAVALDYNPLLRAIGRLEKSRLAVNIKRKNRFFHYLKGLGVDTTESVLNSMCSSFEEV